MVDGPGEVLLDSDVDDPGAWKGPGLLLLPPVNGTDGKASGGDLGVRSPKMSDLGGASPSSSDDVEVEGVAMTCVGGREVGVGVGLS